MLAVVPISVVVGRNNTIDALLVFTLLLAVWTGLEATERGSLEWLLATAAVIWRSISSLPVRRAGCCRCHLLG